MEQANTTAMLNQPGITGGAAVYCENYNNDKLGALYGYYIGTFWSSSEYGKYQAYTRDFLYGYLRYNFKNQEKYVLPVRSF